MLHRLRKESARISCPENIEDLDECDKMWKGNARVRSIISLKFWDIISLVVAFSFLKLNTFILIFNIRSTRFSVSILEGHWAKPWQLDKILRWFIILCGPKSARLSHCFRITLREGRILPLYESLCRAGGKPSTGFPPGTRRAELLRLASLFKFSFF